MATIARSTLVKYTDTLEQLSTGAQEALATQLETLDYSDMTAAINDIVDIMEDLCSQTSSVSAEVASGFYDGMSQLQTGQGYDARSFTGHVPQATEKAVRGIVQQGVDGDLKGMAGQLMKRIDYEVKKAAGETVMQNARRDSRRPRFARVPGGGETCDFCIMLASRGFVYRSEASAGELNHYHANCRCRIVPGFGDNPSVAGYDPDYYLQLWKNQEEARAQRESGAISGALNDANDPWRERRDRHAEQYYQELRQRDVSREAERISNNTEFSEDEIADVFEHLFMASHELHDGYHTFDPDYDIAQSWQRLNSGKGIQPHDILLIRHELYEKELMDSGMSYEEAHELAEERYNYKKGLDEFLKGGGD